LPQLVSEQNNPEDQGDDHGGGEAGQQDGAKIVNRRRNHGHRLRQEGAQISWHESGPVTGITSVAHAHNVVNAQNFERTNVG